MDHQIAVRNKLVERYLLNELGGKDRDDFEEHYFTCDECAEDVRQGAAFVANARTVLRDEPAARSQTAAVRPARNWLRWIWNPVPAYALAGVLALITAVQMSTPSLQPQFVTAAELRPATRGTPQVVRIGPNQTAIQLTAGVPAGAAYACTITDSGGHIVASVDTPVLLTPYVSLLVPAERVRPGRYTLTVRSRQNGAEPFVEQFEFTTEP
jgi:hypothetical protein